MRIPGTEAPTLVVKAPAGLDKLGYAPPREGQQGDARWFEQEAADGLRYCVYVVDAPRRRTPP